MKNNKNNINFFVQRIGLTNNIQWNKNQIVSSHGSNPARVVPCEHATNRKPKEVICKYE